MLYASYESRRLFIHLIHIDSLDGMVHIKSKMIRLAVQNLSPEMTQWIEYSTYSVKVEAMYVSVPKRSFGLRALGVKITLIQLISQHVVSVHAIDSWRPKMILHWECNLLWRCICTCGGVMRLPGSTGVKPPRRCYETVNLKLELESNRDLKSPRLTRLHAQHKAIFII